MKIILSSKVILSLAILAAGSLAIDYQDPDEVETYGNTGSIRGVDTDNYLDDLGKEVEFDDLDEEIADEDYEEEYEDEEEEEEGSEDYFGLVEENEDVDYEQDDDDIEEIDMDYEELSSEVMGRGADSFAENDEEEMMNLNIIEENEDLLVEEIEVDEIDMDSAENGIMSRSYRTNKKKLITHKKNGIDGQWIVTMKEETGASALSVGDLENIAFGVAEDTGTSIDLLMTYSDAIKGFAVSGMNKKAAKKYLKDSRVEMVEQDGTVELESVTWGLDRIDQKSLPLNSRYTPFSSRTGYGVTAYIIDTGILTTHTEFEGRARFGINTVDNNNVDCNGHGTHVAGTVGGRIYGVAKRVSLVSVKVLNCGGSGTWSGVIRGVDWVRGNARGKKATANLSLGGGRSPSVDWAVTNLHNSGVVTVVAAGNSNRDACNYSPARAGPVITVGATTQNDYRASFSNWGRCVDLFAPGYRITSAWIGGTTRTHTISGTSMAAPHVCGAAALYLQGGTTPSRVEAAIEGAATRNKVRNAGSGSPNMLLYVGGGGPTPTRAPTRAPTRRPSGSPSCIAGDNGILAKTPTITEESVTLVRELKVGDKVRGFDEDMNSAECTVEAIGKFGNGEVYGNFTADHFVYNPVTKKIEENGKSDPMTFKDKWDMISDCPLVEDESGKRFGPMDSDFCGSRIKNLSWKNYLKLHKGILNVVRKTGTFWFSESSYKDMATVKKMAPKVCSSMLRCIKDNKKCDKLEQASQKFVDNALTDEAKVKTLKVLNNIGSLCDGGSVSAIVTGGASTSSC